jgi:excisionase family DNA binding protein
MEKMFDLVNRYPELNITVKAKELIEIVEYTIMRTRKETEQQAANIRKETYLSRDEVADMLRVDKSTLWRWNRDNYLIHIEVGGKRRYRMSEVKRILGENRHGNN